MRVLFIGKVWPEPASSAAGTRMMQLLQFFTHRGHEVFFGSAAAFSPFSEDLSTYRVCPFEVTLNHVSFDEKVKHLDPAIVVFDRFMTEEQFGWRVAENCPGALRILDTEDLHFLREAREGAIKRGAQVSDADLFSESAQREIASIYRCDLSLIISMQEINLLKNVFQVPGELLYYLPYLADALTEKSTQAWPSFSERQHFISIGNFLHAPNLDGVVHLKQNIWPLIRHKIAEAELHVYGSYGQQYTTRFHAPDEGFIMKGRAANSAEVMSAARVCLAPLRFGAGLKGKLVEAMKCGTPSVTTSTGVEGLGNAAVWPGYVTDDAEQFAEAAVALYEKEDKWNGAVKKIVPCYNATFDRVKYEAGLEGQLKSSLSALHELRLKNFTGAMLSQNMQHAKRWLGKYLEIKNVLRQTNVYHTDEKEKNRPL